MTFYISPYRRLSTLRQAMDRLLEENLAETATPEREMVLAVDVEAQDEAFTVKALVPGLAADDINIEILNNTVSIRGEFMGIEGEANYMINELPTGKFSRVITLPTALDAARVEAKIKDGVLTLSIPKAESHRPKAIKVSTN